ncbi:MAG: hypothetical protein M0Q53_07100 [Prolixibacteraceae bacterium]|jgi:hypothetical protein|nr:hypothetical protein [Prolixibacteraceae bacterium]
MKQIKSLRIIILVVGVLLILVIIRNSDQNVFQEKAKTALEATRNDANIVSFDQVKALTAPYLILDLGSAPRPDSLLFQHALKITFSQLLEKANRKILNEAKGELILYADDVPTASRAWVILNQLGYKNLRILSFENIPEGLKYKFQPDTTSRLEQDTM